MTNIGESVRLKSKKTQKYALLFDAAFNFYKDTQLYSFDHTVKALEKKDTSFVEKIAKFFNKKREENTKVLIQDIESLNGQFKYIYCHKQNVSDLNIKIPSCYYTGKEIKPKVNIPGRKLNAEYSLSFSNNVKIGTAKVTIKGKGDYLKGSAVKTFKIVPNNVSDLKAAKITSNSVTLTWKKVPGDVTYYIYSYNSKADRLKQYTQVASTTKLSVTVKNLKPSTKYSYVVRACSKVGGTNYWSPKYSSVCPIKTPVAVSTPGVTKSLKATQSTSAIKLAWSKVAGATGYRVYRHDGKKWVKLADTKNTTYTVSKLKAGTNYKYAVKAYTTVGKTVYWSASYAQISTATKPATPTVKVSAGKKQAALSWNKVTGASGYVVYYSTSKNGTYKKLATVKGTSYTAKKLATGKTYYFKVAAYKTVGKANIYGAYSTVKGVKVK